ncbi:MAG TPA: ROK family protein [Rectinemataceae bacterium]|nr:ROK family protein [Rectinemataceae bacterium]
MAFGQLIDQRKLNKRNHVVGLFREHGPLSKARVRQISGYSMDTLISIFKSLEDEAYLRPLRPSEADSRGVEAPASSARAKGRPAELYSLEDERELYLGLTFNQAGIYSVLVSFSGRVMDIRREDLPTLETQSAFEASFASHLLAFLASNSERIPRIRRVGLALPGQVDSERGILRHYGLMPFLKDLDLGRLIRRHLAGAPLSCRHNVAGLARYLLSDRSLTKESRRILYVSARAGAAHALIQDGRLLLDEGEMGHLRICASDERCECGRVGCLDTVFSAGQFHRLFPGMSWADVAAGLVREGGEGRSELRLALEPGWRAFCEALLDLCAAFSPDLVLFSGELFAMLPDPLSWIRGLVDTLIDSARPPAWFPREFRYTMTGSEAAAIGLCQTLMEEDWAWQPDRASGRIEARDAAEPKTNF